MMAELRAELEPARGDDIGRHGDDGGARVDRAFGGFHRDAASGVDHRCRRRQVNIEALAERGDQRAESLLAEGRSIALGERAQSRTTTPAANPWRRCRGQARIRWSRASRRDRSAWPARRECRLCAPPRRWRAWREPGRSGNPPARPRAHNAGRCAPSGFAAPDRCRCRARGVSLVTGIGVRQIDPMRAAIERHAEALHIGDAAAADMIGRFDHHIAPAGGGKPARGGDAGGAGADDDDIERARDGAAPSRRAAGRAASAAEAARNERRLNCRGLPGMVSKTLSAPPQIARTAHGGQTPRFNVGSMTRAAVNQIATELA